MSNHSKPFNGPLLETKQIEGGHANLVEIRLKNQHKTGQSPKKYRFGVSVIREGKQIFFRYASIEQAKRLFNIF